MPFLAIDLLFFGANLMKVLDGGYVPLLVAALVVTIVRVWMEGTRLLAIREARMETPLPELLDMLGRRPPATISGAAIYLTAHADHAPVALLHTLKHFGSLHERNLILTVATADVPRVPDAGRVRFERLDDRFCRATMTFGYMEAPDVPHGLDMSPDLAREFDAATASFIVSRRTLKPAADGAMPAWRSRLFIFLARNAAGATDYFRIPAGRVVEIGTQVNL